MYFLKCPAPVPGKKPDPGLTAKSLASLLENLVSGRRLLKLQLLRRLAQASESCRRRLQTGGRLRRDACPWSTVADRGLSRRQVQRYAHASKFHNRSPHEKTQ